MGIGWTEIVLILVVALVLLGPSRFPAAARRLGSYYREIKDSFGAMEREFERAVELDETTGQAVPGNGQEASAPVGGTEHSTDGCQPVLSNDATGESLTDEVKPR